MNTKMKKQNERAVKSFSPDRLAEELRFWLSEERRWLNGQNEPYVIGQVRPMIEVCVAELERRENGGAILDEQRPYISDGEYLAAGMEPPSDNL